VHEQGNSNLYGSKSDRSNTLHEQGCVNGFAETFYYGLHEQGYSNLYRLKKTLGGFGANRYGQTKVL
jgi:hypothetical protein